MPGHRCALLALATTLAIVLGACAATSTSSPTLAPTSTATASLRSSASSAAAPPFSLDFPDGWVAGTPADLNAYIAELGQTDNVEARKLKKVLESAATPTSTFVAYQVGSSDAFLPNVGCTTLVTPPGMTTAEILDLAEQQNVEGIAQMPNVDGKPVADRVQLVPGEAVRVRWRWTEVDQGDRSSIGYLFVHESLVVTCVFSAATATIASHEREWETILATFKLAR